MHAGQFAGLLFAVHIIFWLITSPLFDNPTSSHQTHLACKYVTTTVAGVNYTLRCPSNEVIRSGEQDANGDAAVVVSLVSVKNQYSELHLRFSMPVARRQVTDTSACSAETFRIQVLKRETAQLVALSTQMIEQSQDFMRIKIGPSNLMKVEQPFLSHGDRIIVELEPLRDCFHTEPPYLPLQLRSYSTDNKNTLADQHLPPLQSFGTIAWIISVTGDLLSVPWWFCADLVHQSEVLNNLEMVSFSAPFSSAYGFPPRFQQPSGFSVRHINSAATQFLETCFPRSSFQVDEIQLMQDSGWFSTMPQTALVFVSLGIDDKIHDVRLETSTDTNQIQLAFTCVHGCHIHECLKANMLQPNTPNSLGEPQVYFVTAVAGRERRLRHVLQLHHANFLQGDRFGLCIVDFDSINQFNMSLLLSQLPNTIPIIHVRQPGAFNKVTALQKCISLLSPNTIMFILDVDIDFEMGLADTVRQYVRKGARFFAPIVHYDNFDNDNNVFPDSPAGWATGGTGLIGVYVSDARAIGGYDTERFGTSHGWEDTDFFFRLRAHGLQVARFRMNTLTHVAHGRKGTWVDDSTLQRTSEVFNCQDQTLWLQHLAYDVTSRLLQLNVSSPNDGNVARFKKELRGAAVYYRFMNSTSAKVSLGSLRDLTVHRSRGPNILVEPRTSDNAGSGPTWLTLLNRRMDILQILPLRHPATLTTSWHAIEGKWLEYAYSNDISSYSMTRKPVDPDDIFTIGFFEPLAVNEIIQIRTGSAEHPQARLYSAKMRVYFDVKTETKEVSFVNGVAELSFSKATAVTAIAILITNAQSQPVVIDSIDIY